MGDKRTLREGADQLNIDIWTTRNREDNGEREHSGNTGDEPDEADKRGHTEQHTRADGEEHDRQLPEGQGRGRLDNA